MLLDNAFQGNFNNKLFSKTTEVPFVGLFSQGNWVPQETLFSLFSNLAVKIQQYFLNLINSRAKRFDHILKCSVTHHY